MLYLGNCLEIMGLLEPASVDMVFADLPYGTTYAKWDSVIDMASFWTSIATVCKEDAAIVMTSVQPFTTALISSNPNWFRVAWVWDKANASNFANANRHPMKVNEDVIIFSKKPCRYFPQKTAGAKNHTKGVSKRNRRAETMGIDPSRSTDDDSGMKFPKSIQRFPKHSSQLGNHPTEKPVELMEYFIKTYSLPGELVMDPTMGSGSTGVACSNTYRRFIGIEKDESYFKVAKRRIVESGGLI